MARTKKSPNRKLIRMKKQRVLSQMKGQNKTPEKQLNEVEIGTSSEKEFRIMIVKMIQDLRKTMKKMQEMFTKDLQELENKQIGINSRITEDSLKDLWDKIKHMKIHIIWVPERYLIERERIWENI